MAISLIPLVRPGRDLRVDFLRGLALWFIFIDHTPGNLLGLATLRNVAFCDATEAFVLLAGFAAGIAYGRIMEREGWLQAAGRVMGRVGTLYVAHIFLFVVFTAQVGFSAAALDQAAYLDELALDPFTQEPYRALLEALLLRYQPAFLDILPLYIVVLALFAVTLPMIRRPIWMLAGASVLYVVTRSFELEPPAWNGQSWSFNPFAWQLLFVIGIWLGRADPVKLSQHFPWNRWIALLLVVLLIVAAALLNFFWHGATSGIEMPERLSGWMASIDKTSLHPARLASVLIMCWLISHLLPPGAAFLFGRTAGSFILMGQHSLPVFCAGIFLSFLGRVAIEMSDSLLMQLLVNVAGLAAMLGVGAVSAWYDDGGRRKAQALPTAGQKPKVDA